MRANNYTWGGHPALKDDASPWGSGAPSSSIGGWGDAEASLQELENRAERSAASIAASQQRMLQLAQSAEQTGAATLSELHSQGETLKRIQKDQVRPCL